MDGSASTMESEHNEQFLQTLAENGWIETQATKDDAAHLCHLAPCCRRKYNLGFKDARSLGFPGNMEEVQ